MNNTWTRYSYLFQSLLAVAFLIGLPETAAAQIRLAPLHEVTVIGKEDRAKSVCTADAGEIDGFVNVNLTNNSLGNVSPGGTASYTASPSDTVFLCRGDEFTISLDPLSAEYTASDPNPLTPGGVVWGLYKCPPTESGPTRADLDSDVCNFDNGLPPFDGDSSLIAIPVNFEAGNFDFRVENIDGPYVQEFFPGPSGDPSPVVVYTAPLVINDRRPDGSFVFESTAAAPGVPGEQCTNVRTDQYVALGFLNPIEIVDAFQSTVNCQGSFEIQGGISELRNSREYAIEIIDPVTGALGALTSGNPAHGDEVNYTVPVPGTYEIRIEDGIGCGAVGTVVHTAACSSAADPTIGSVTIGAVSCPGVDDGTLTTTVSGGVAPYDVRLETTSGTLVDTKTVANSGETVMFENLSGGNYRIRVEDAAGGTDVSSLLFVDEEAEFLPFIVDATGGSCAGTIDYALTVRVNVNAGADIITNPTQNGYSVRWSTGETTDTIRNVTPGTDYSVTVTQTTNPAACTASSGNFRLTARNEVFIAGTPTTEEASCQGSADGEVRLEARGGVPGAAGYRFEFSDGVIQVGRTVTRNDLEPGSYTVIATDSVGCSSNILEGEFTITADKILAVNADQEDISCFGEVDGSLSVTASSTGSRPVVLPYEARLASEDGTVIEDFANIPAGGPRVYDNLPAGVYLVSVRDQDPANCITTDTFTIGEPDSLFIEEVTTVDFGCPDQFGSASVVVSGGTGPFTYYFRNDSLPDPVDTLMTFDSLVVDTNFIGDLQPDTNYVVIVTDANGCVDSTTFQIFSPPRAAIAPIQTDSLSCPDSNDGQLFTTVTPPTGETVTETAWYRFNNDGSIGEQIDIGTRTSADLEVGFYLFEATISNNCVSQAIGEVTSPGLVALDSFMVTPPQCLGDENGSIFVYPAGGTPPYRYDWSVPGASTNRNSITNLSAGEYSVTITDANGCQPAFDTTFTLADPVGITGSFTSLVPVSCPDETTTDGSATFTAALTDGTTANFDFFWSSGDTTLSRTNSTATELPRGPITVTVTDGSCPQTFTDTIPSPPNFTVALETEDASCNGQQNGSATVLVSGGTPDYNFNWAARPETGNTITGVGAGTYEVDISDANGCELEPVEVTITEPDALVLSIDSDLTTPTVTCTGDEDGRIVVFVSSNNNNPFPDNPYQWSSNVTDNDDGIANGLAPGSYGVTVTDVEGCQDSLQYTVIEPQPITFAVQSILDPRCFGETTQVLIDTAFGGQASGFTDYTFMLNNDGFLIPATQPGQAFAGELTVTVLDSVGCTAEQTFTINQPEEIEIELPNRLVVELGDSLAQLNPIVTPADNYSYRWTPPTYLSSDSIRNPTVFPLSNVNYTFTATNPNGCEAFEDILVEIDPNRNVFIPTAFSPNRDGRNEDFRIFGCRGVVAIPLVRIFDRWGGMMFEAKDLPADCLDGTVIWDGRSAEGQDVNTGVYVYTAEVLFLDGQTLTYRGEISVLR